MPTQSTTYNTRLTDESLEKRFRETFRSQGGSELVDDLYASGVIVPVVDFTAAAEGSGLRQDLQRAWDLSTSDTQVHNTSTTIISTPGFWQIDVRYLFTGTGGSAGTLTLQKGIVSSTFFRMQNATAGLTTEETYVVFVRTDDEIVADASAGAYLYLAYRQIADVYGNLTNPTGYVSQ